MTSHTRSDARDPLREAARRLLATEIGYEWDDTGTPEEAAVTALRAALSAPPAPGLRERVEALRVALWSVITYHGHSNADTDCPSCALGHRALAAAPGKGEKETT